MDVAELRAVIEAETSGFTRAMRGVNSDLDRTAQHMGAVDNSSVAMGRSVNRSGKIMHTAMIAGGIAIAGVGVAAGIAGFGLYKSIQAASDLSETMNKANVIFGKGGKDIIAWSKTSATALGQSRTQAIEAASTFAIFGKSAGLSGKDLTGFSKDLVGLSADLASFHNASPQEAIDAIGAALRGESEPMRRFGVLIDDAALRAEALKQGLISTTKDALTPQQRALAANALIMKQTKDAQGDFARTSGGLANQQRILSAEFDNAKIAIGTAFLPLVNMLMPKLTQQIPIVIGYVTQFTDAFAKFSTQLLGNEQTMSSFGDTTTSVFDRISTVVNSFLNPIRAAFASLSNDPKTAAASLTMFNSVISNIGTIIQKVAPALGTYLGAAIQAIGKIATAVMPIISDALDKIVPPLTRIAVASLKFEALMMRILGTVIPPLVRGLAPIFSVAFTAIGAILNTIASLMEGDFSGAFQNAITAVKTIFLTLPMIIQTTMLNAAGVALSAAADVGVKLISGIANAISSGAGKIGSAISGAIREAITNIDIPGFSPPDHAAAQAIGEPLARGVAMGFLNGTADLPAKMSDRIKTALTAAKNGISSQQSALSAQFQRLASGVMRAFDAETAKGVRSIQDRLAAAVKTANAGFDVRIGSLASAGAALTPAEAELLATQNAHDKMQREQDKKDAQDALALAQTEGNAADILSAQRRLDDILYQEKMTALQTKADAERLARDADTSEKIASIETERTDTLAALQKTYDDEQLQYESSREVMRTKREDELARLETFLNTANGKWMSKTKALTAFMNRSDIKQAMADSGANLGTAFADALTATKGKVTSAVKALAKLVRDYLELHSPAKIGPLSTLDKWWNPLSDTLVSGVDTSMIGNVSASIASPDFAVAAGSGNNGSSSVAPLIVNVTVQGSVTSESDLVSTIRSELIRTGQRNGSIFGGYA